jgi:hypothetical protein
MMFTTRSSVSLGLLALAATSSAEALYSRRMAKRGLDAQGNYNICESLVMIMSEYMESVSHGHSFLPHQ